MNYKIEPSTENLQTSVLAIMQMTPKNREKFYASEEGQDIVKGLFIEAEQNKKAKADGMNWTEEDIEKLIYALRQASEDDFKIFLQLMPVPVFNRVSEHFHKEIQDIGYCKTVIEKGAKVGTAGYELWLAKRRQHMNVSHAELNKPISGGVKAPKAPKPIKPAGQKNPKAPKPVGYGKFIAKKPKDEKKGY